MWRLATQSLLIAITATAVDAQEAAIQRHAPESGTVVSQVSGEQVRFVAEPAFRPLVVGQDLLGGDLVQTGQRGALGILFVDGTVMRLHPQTEFLVKSVGAAAELELRRGTLWARSPRGRSDVRVVTPAAAAGIRGTDWVLSVESGGLTRLTVYDGAVELANAQGSLVTSAGQSAQAAPGRAPVRLGVANRREAAQMLYTIGTSEAVDLLATATEDLSPAALDPPEAIAAYRRGLTLVHQRDPEAAEVLEKVAPRLSRERAASARWLAAFARMETGRPLVPPPASNAAADAVGAAAAAALSGDLDRAQVVLDSVARSPAVDAAAVQIAILRDDTERARERVDAMTQQSPGAVATLDAQAKLAADVDGDHTTALRLLRRAVRLAPERAALWNDLGGEEAALDHPLEAEKAYRTGLALQPQDPALLGNLALLLLDLERIEEAKAIAGQMLARDPGSYLALRVLGRAAVQAGDSDAQGILLRALAAQPAAAEASILLGTAAYMDGDETRGAQELDAAGRLDPNDPIVPLVRAIKARDANRVDEAIVAARLAAGLLVRQDRSNRVVAADRQAGSPLSDAYATIGLDGWARYVADRTYDPLSATSLFTEGTLNRLTIGRDGPSANGHDGSFANGLMLEPLAASYRLRQTDILRRPFLDAQLSLDLGDGDNSAALDVMGLVRTPVPLAFALNLSGTEAQADPLTTDFHSGLLAVGSQFGARGGAFLALQRDRSRTTGEQPTFAGRTNLSETAISNETIGFGGHLRLNERSFLTVFAGHARRDASDSVLNFVRTRGGVLQVAASATQKATSDRLFLGYQAEDTSGYWTSGLEFSRVSEDNKSNLTVTDISTGASLAVSDASKAETDNFRAFLGRRQRLGPALTGEALLTFDRIGDLRRNGGRLGLAWSPAPGHWLRAAAVAEGFPAGSSLAPVSAVGLVPVRLPYRSDGKLDGVMLRYDVEVGERLLFGLEHQNLRTHGLRYPTGDPTADLEIERASLAVTTLRGDWWIGKGVGLSGQLIHTDSRMRDGAFRGAPLPSTPEWTGVLGLAWLNPSGLGGSLDAVWTSEQFSGTPDGPLKPVLTVDAGLHWESEDKRLAARLAVTNLFDTPIEQPWNLPAKRGEVRLNLIARF